ncbi:hypothetical protein OZX57_01925 [Bifidobacterium sp. ESL0682]|uniref:hypothetical protein n=1 Tax=Bifidobacterium sp. ESL0682 TaxID=2983212 RepID=UPI0023F6AAFB|nr:hypothetical protein [Bifidobacterium sp. ESL0682]WEV42267.1 hypothetical protein OZX57_01925 [Bifidobacterium sp. ESL0682]
MTSQQPKKRDSSNDANRKPNKEMQRVYLRRRIVVVIVALVLVALIGFGVYALVTKASAAHGHDGQAASSSAASNAHKKTGRRRPTNPRIKRAMIQNLESPIKTIRTAKPIRAA